MSPFGYVSHDWMYDPLTRTQRICKRCNCVKIIYVQPPYTDIRYWHQNKTILEEPFCVERETP